MFLDHLPSPRDIFFIRDRIYSAYIYLLYFLFFVTICSKYADANAPRGAVFPAVKNTHIPVANITSKPRKVNVKR